MKVCILSTVDMSRMTMARIYTDYMDRNNIDYDFIYVDKFKDPIMGNPKNTFAFSAEGFENSSFAVKLMHYWKMRKFAVDIFKEQKYDFLIVWSSLTTFIFADIIKKFFKDRCCINIRDFFFNDKALMNRWLGVAMNNSSFNTVSSDILIDYLPGKKFIPIYSLNEGLVENLESRTKIRQEDEPIRIMYIGWIGRLEYAYKLIDELGNDKRFELYFVGMGSEDIDEYIKDKDIFNVFTHGKFPQDETAEHLKKADVIYNLYGHGNKHFDTALSIKLYYAIFMHIPLLGFEGTYTLDVAKKCGIGYGLSSDDFSGLGDNLYKFYREINQDEIVKKCDDYIAEIRQSNLNLIEALDDILLK